MLKALAPYPEARGAVVLALRDMDSDDAPLSDSDDAVRDLADNAEQQIGVVAAEAIERAKAAGKVEIA
jgi:hypothetical protein